MNILDLASAITNELENYTQNVTDGVKNAVDTVAEETNKEIKNHITFKQHTKDYVKAFRLKTSFQDRYNKRKTWYVGNDQYRLTHLLENGHELRQGGRAKAYPHIKFGEELAKKRMEELAKEAIENANRR